MKTFVLLEILFENEIEILLHDICLKTWGHKNNEFYSFVAEHFFLQKLHGQKMMINDNVIGYEDCLCSNITWRPILTAYFIRPFCEITE